MYNQLDASGINQIIELLTQINNRINANDITYNDPFIDGIHRNFPDLLYNYRRFVSVEAVMEYVNHQMQNNYNTYNRAFTNYWSNVNANQNIEQPPPIQIPPRHYNNPHAIPVTPPPINQFDGLFHGINNNITEILNGARILNSLSNATTRTQTPVDSPILGGGRGQTYMDDEFILNSFSTPPRPPRVVSDAPPPIPRQSAGARQFLRTLIPDFLDGTRGNMFVATARTYRIHPLTQLSQENNGLTDEQINANTHVEQRNEGDCAICCDDYSGNDLRVINRCNHAFHIECIDPWFRGNRTCPMCRANVIDDVPGDQTDDNSEPENS
jgi:hypothetical protein